MRRLPCILIPAISLALFAASNAFANPCGHDTHGDIGNRYLALGGSDGPLGCPTNDEEDHPEGWGRRQNFEHGQMVWMPDADNRAPGVVAAWQDGGYIVVDWSIGHYNYDFFLVRWDRDGYNIGQDNVQGGPRTSGRWNIGTAGPGTYRIVTKGCDGSIFGSTCRQDWSLPIYVYIG